MARFVEVRQLTKQTVYHKLDRYFYKKNRQHAHRQVFYVNFFLIVHHRHFVIYLQFQTTPFLVRWGSKLELACCWCRMNKNHQEQKEAPLTIMSSIDRVQLHFIWTSFDEYKYQFFDVQQTKFLACTAMTYQSKSAHLPIE